MSHLESLEILYLNGTKTGLDGLKAIILNIRKDSLLEKVCLMSNYPHAEVYLCEEVKSVKSSKIIDLRVDHTHDEYLFKNRRCTDFDEEKPYKSDDE